MMESILVVLTIASFAAITPGPNNIIVMQAAAAYGFFGALPAIIGVVTGTWLLTLLIWAGFNTLLVSAPWLPSIIGMAGSGYLIWLGAKLVFSPAITAEQQSQHSDPVASSLWPVLLFQFVNPKALVLITTLLTELTLGYSPATSLAILLAVMTAVSILCLSLWAGAGHAIADLLEKTDVRRLFNIIMGMLLLLPAMYIMMGHLTGSWLS